MRKRQLARIVMIAAGTLAVGGVADPASADGPAPAYADGSAPEVTTPPADDPEVGTNLPVTGVQLGATVLLGSGLVAGGIAMLTVRRRPPDLVVTSEPKRSAGQPADWT